MPERKRGFKVEISCPRCFERRLVRRDYAKTAKATVNRVRGILEVLLKNHPEKPGNIWNAKIAQQNFGNINT